MTVRERRRSGNLTDFSVYFQVMLTYRVPMKVEELLIFPRWPQDASYYRCPRCQELLEREFLAYCANCGQCLDWREYRKVKQIRYKTK
jgi:hypothetical protein